MVKRITLLLISLLLFSELAWAQRAAQEDDRLARKKFEEDQRADEYANSLRRRDWLKDRLILEIGMGSKYPVMGSNWFGFGAAVEYITRWHVAAFASIGFIPSQIDPVFNEGDYNLELEGGMGWRFGIAYYLFPKNPIHLSFQASYGTVYYDHVASDLDANGLRTGIRPLLLAYGYEFDIAVTYLSDQWYFLQALVGVYTIGNGKKGDREDNPDKASSSLSNWSFGRKNPSWSCGFDDELQEDVCNSLVTSLSGRDEEGNHKEAMPPVGVVFGIGIGFAFEEFFPDDTEIRRREREEARDKQNSFRSDTPKKQPSRRAASRAARGGINTDDEVVEEE